MAGAKKTIPLNEEDKKRLLEVLESMSPALRKWLAALIKKLIELSKPVPAPSPEETPKNGTGERPQVGS